MPTGLFDDDLTRAAVADDDAVLDAARRAGLPAVVSADLAVDPAAVALLPDGTGALGVAVVEGRLRVVLASVPVRDDLERLAAAAGMPVEVAVAVPSVFARLAHAARPDGSPASVGSALRVASVRGASDVHLSPGSPPVLRIAGDLHPLDRWPPLTAADLDAAARWVGVDPATFSGDHDGAVDYGGARWRVNVFRHRKTLALALRRIPDVVPSVETLDLPASVVALADLARGLVLFCGPTGSGKSTTQAALLDRINRRRRCHIVTIEDPIEYVHRDRLAVVHQREVGDDTPDFATGLRHVLRQDPDVILVGELRDLETTRTAVTAAETGHLVFATVHANSAADAVSRIVDQFPALQQAQVRTQLAASLQGVVAQLLLPRADRPLVRQVVCEVLVATPGVRNLVRDNKLHEIASVIESQAESGMVSFDRALAELVVAGRLDETVAAPWVRAPASFADFVRRARAGGLSRSGRGASVADLDALT